MFYHFTVDSLVVAQASSIGKAHSGLVPRLFPMSTLPDFQDEKELPSIITVNGRTFKSIRVANIYVNSLEHG